MLRTYVSIKMKSRTPHFSKGLDCRGPYILGFVAALSMLSIKAVAGDLTGSETASTPAPVIQGPPGGGASPDTVQPPSAAPENPASGDSSSRRPDGYLRSVPKTQIQDQAGTSNGISQIEAAQRKLDRGASAYDPDVSSGFQLGTSQANGYWANYRRRWDNRNVEPTQALEDTLKNTLRLRLLERRSVGAQNSGSDIVKERADTPNPSKFGFGNGQSGFAIKEIPDQSVQPNVSSLLPPITANTAFSTRDLSSKRDLNKESADSPIARQITNLPLADESEDRSLTSRNSEIQTTGGAPGANVTVNSRQDSKLIAPPSFDASKLVGNRSPKDALGDLEQEASEVLAFLRNKDGEGEFSSPAFVSPSRGPSSFGNKNSVAKAGISNVALGLNENKTNGKVRLTDGPNGLPVTSTNEKAPLQSVTSTSSNAELNIPLKLIPATLAFLFLCSFAYYFIPWLIERSMKVLRNPHATSEDTTPEEKTNYRSDLVVGNCNINYWFSRPGKKRSQRLVRSKPVLPSGIKELTKPSR